MGAHLGAQLRALRFFFVDASFSLLRLRERNWIDARAIVPENYLFEKFEWHYCVTQLTEIIICTSYIGPPFQESYTMLTSPKKDETSVPTLSVQILRKLAVLSSAVLCWFKSFRFFWKFRHILFENLPLSDNPFLCDTVYWQNIYTLRDRNTVVAENPSFANLAWPHCVTILRDGNIVDLHRPSSIVHRPSSIVQRPASSVQRPASSVQRPASWF